MKKKIIHAFIITMFFVINLNHAQGNDVIFLIDNSSSVSNTEFNQMSTSINSIMTNVLNCNVNNRVSVVHYGTSIIDTSTQPNNFPKIFIESDFTNDLTTALTYQRRLNSGDYLHESTQLLGSALDGILNNNIVSPQKQLNNIPQNNLVVFVFSDASRGTSPITPPVSGSASYLVNATNPTNQPFQIYNDFKINRNATFFVIHFPPNIAAQQAGSAIASIGGPYNGPIENPGAPDFNQTPRYYYLTNSFTLSPVEILNISDDLCSITDDPCDISTITNTITINPPSLVWSAPTGYTGNYFLEFIGSNDCPGGEIGNTINTVQYTLSTNSINLLQVVNDLDRKCFRYRIRTDCSDWSNWCLLGTSPETGSQFVQYSDCIPSNPCDSYSNFINITDNVLSGTTMDYLTYINIEATNTIQNSATSTYRASNSIILKTGFHAEDDSNFKASIDDCSNPNPILFAYSNDSENLLINERNHNKKSNIRIKLFPNPTKEKLNISSTEEIVQWQLSNKFGKQLKISDIKIPSNQIELNLHDLPSDIYILKITLVNGDVVTKKIIKN